MEIAETENRKTLLFLVRNGDLRRFVDALFGYGRRIRRGCRRFSARDRLSQRTARENRVRACEMTRRLQRDALITRTGAGIDLLQDQPQLLAKVVHVLKTIFRFLGECAVDRLLQARRDRCRTQFGDRRGGSCSTACRTSIVVLPRNGHVPVSIS